MKVFISWSGSRSHAMALALRDWLPYILQGVDVFVSSEDLRSGGRWGVELASHLESTSYGIACLASDNLDSPWLHFEAGALTKSVGSSFLATILLDIEPAALRSPLSDFQAVALRKDRVLKLLKDMSDAGSLGVEDRVLTGLLDKFWPELEQTLAEIPEVAEPPEHVRPDRELLEEILQLVRGQRRETAGRDLALTWAQQVQPAAERGPTRAQANDTLTELLQRLRANQPLKRVMSVEEAVNLRRELQHQIDLRMPGGKANFIAREGGSFIVSVPEANMDEAARTGLRDWGRQHGVHVGFFADGDLGPDNLDELGLDDS